MRKLEIDWGELSIVFETGFGDMQHYLDLETGKVVMVTDEARWYQRQPPDELLEWQREMLQVARQVEEGYGTRYIQIPEQDSRVGYRDMEYFIRTVQDGHLRDQLWQAIQGQGAFRQFKDVLVEYPAERERWFAFRDNCVHKRIVDWLTVEGIEPTNPVEPSV
jgi:hypothetical protein